MDQWTVQVRFSDAFESAPFSTRQDALDHAFAVLQDYNDNVDVAIFDSSGHCELVYGFAFESLTWMQ